MLTKEIKVRKYELQDCNNNLKQLSMEWSGIPKLSESIVSDSVGYTADAAKTCIGLTQQLSHSMQQLLDNSIIFFENLGISFEESDATASKKIEEITKA